METTYTLVHLERPFRLLFFGFFFSESPFIHLERMENMVETRLGDTVRIPVKFKGYPPPEVKW